MEEENREGGGLSGNGRVRRNLEEDRQLQQQTEQQNQRFREEEQNFLANGSTIRNSFFGTNIEQTNLFFLLQNSFQKHIFFILNLNHRL